MAITHQIGSYAVSDDVLSGIRAASRTTGVDFSYMMAKAARESSFRHDVRAGTSSATGLYQFIDQTWLGMVSRYGDEHGLGRYASQIDETAGRFSVSDPTIRQEILDLRLDPTLNATMAGEYANENRDHLERTTGRQVGPTDLYLAHFLGAGGASEFLNAMDRSPGRSGADLFPAAARANRAIFQNRDGSDRTLAQIYDRFGDQVRRDMALAADLPDAVSGGPSGGVADLWTGGSGRGPVFGAGVVTSGQMGAPGGAPVGARGGSDSVANAAYWLQMAGGEEIRRDVNGHFSGRDLSLWTVLTLSSMSAPGDATLTGGPANGRGDSDSPDGQFDGRTRYAPDAF